MTPALGDDWAVGPDGLRQRRAARVIVLDDADLDQALDGSLFTSFNNSGQICTSGSRLLVQESIADEFVARLVERASKIAVGDPADPATQMGPLVSAEQLERVRGYVDLGAASGARQVVPSGPACSSPPRAWWWSASA